MSARKLYKKRPQYFVTAVQLDLDFKGFSFRKWGNEQKCSAGDWLVNNGGDIYTVEKEYFQQHYQEISPGKFEKLGPVWAEAATESGNIDTIEGKTAYQTGDYLVYDRPEGGDAYAIKKQKFEQFYELVQSEEELTDEQNAYIDERIGYHVQWYNTKAVSNRVQYHFWQTLAIVSAALVPILSTLNSDNGFLIASMGGASALCAGLLSLFKYQENWVKFRAACEDLRSHLAQYKIATGTYEDRGAAFKILAENCERIISAERGQWVQQNTPKSSKKQ